MLYHFYHNTTRRSNMILKSLNNSHKQQQRNFAASNLQVMIFGSSTDVGKTIVSAGVCRAALKHGRKVSYIKPVQTGELDEYFVSLYTNPQGISDIFLRTLHYYSTSIAPHIAARIHDHEGPISDDQLVWGLKREMKAFDTNSDASPEGKKQLFTVVETAGGVLSPGPSKSLQVTHPYSFLQILCIIISYFSYD